MIIKTVKVTDKGQISIPSDIREIVGIQKGDELLISENKGKILLKKTYSIEKKIRDDFKDMDKVAESSLMDVWDNEEDEVWNNYLK